jgi:RHS repeat-associated protein
VPDLGLMDYNARFYDSSLGRFIQADTIVPELGSSQNINRYSYTLNNPCRYTDSTGHFPSIGVFIGEIIATIIYNNFIRNPSAPADANASNIIGLLWLGYEHADHVNIVGEGLKDVQDDPTTIEAQEIIIEKITADPRYGFEAFDLPDSIEYSEDINTHGPSRNWKQAVLENNQAFWMVHDANIYATDISVSSDGTISTTWMVDDTFENSPSRYRDLEYNICAVLTYIPYNIILGSKAVKTNAYWNDIIPPKKESPMLNR